MWGAFEDDAVGGEEEGALCWKDVRSPQEAPCGLLSSVGVEDHPQPLWHQLLPREQRRPQDLRLEGRGGGGGGKTLLNKMDQTASFTRCWVKGMNMWC